MRDAGDGERAKMSKSKNLKKRKNPGPKPEILKITDNWRDTVKKSLEVKKPVDGWPK